jgi:beta-N-acetylhexosaminidase
VTTTRELIGRTLVFGIPGPVVTDADKRLFRDTGAAGLILYRINYRSPAQIKKLIRDLEEAVERRLLVTVDHEGGRVVMFGGGVTVFPDSLAFGHAGRVDWARAQGRVEGRELRRLGIDVNFAPTVDVLTEAFSPNIGIRSYGRDPRAVGALAAARVRAMQAQGVSACAKHFPGLGPATRDPHLDLPVIDTGWTELRRRHLAPFRDTLRAGVDLVMTSHPLYPRLTGGERIPVTFSRRLTHDLLRGELGFRGVVASDDLEMGALRRFGGPGASAVRAARAGHDLILCCHRADWQRDVHRALTAAHRAGELKTADLDKSVERIEALRGARRPRFAPGAPRPEKGGDALADRVARAGVRARIGETSLPLPLSSRTLVLFPRLRPLARKIFIEETVQHPESLFPRGPRLRTLPHRPRARRHCPRPRRGAPRGDRGFLLLRRPFAVREPAPAQNAGKHGRSPRARDVAGSLRHGRRPPRDHRGDGHRPPPLPDRGRAARGLRSMTPTPSVVAVDRGGSDLRLFAARAGRVVAQWRGPTRPLASMKKWLEEFWAARGWTRADRLIVGSKGIWSPGERRAWARRWAAFADDVTVMSDVELGHHAVLGTRPGVTLVGGTGSIAIRRDARGRWARAGGRGPRNGDEGSGWWIGKEFLKRAGRSVPARPSPDDVRSIAGRAESVLKDASPRARALRAEAVGHLAALVAALRPERGHPVVLTGSLFKNLSFRRAVERRLGDLAGLKCLRADENPARRAARRPGQFPPAPTGGLPRRGARK